LQRSSFLDDLTGQMFLSQNEAFSALIAIADEENALNSNRDPWLARGLI
jgi:sulfate permease, SulP family